MRSGFNWITKGEIERARKYIYEELEKHPNQPVVVKVTPPPDGADKTVPGGVKNIVTAYPHICKDSDGNFWQYTDVVLGEHSRYRIDPAELANTKNGMDGVERIDFSAEQTLQLLSSRL